MTPTRSGSLRLFRLAGIEVFVHWSWFLVGWYEINQRSRQYSSLAWNIAEYLALFATVLMHEFGHSLACRQVGGKADQIVLWPLGGVAYVSPPQRPGAMLWSIAAGPLVNVALLAVFLLLSLFAGRSGLVSEDVQGFVQAMVYLNAGLLLFNLLPVYPLDGGQILRSLLWFVIGRAKSLLVSSVIGFIGVAGLLGLAVLQQSMWLGIMAAFIGMNCWQGWKHARVLATVEKVPRHAGYACPSCGMAPPKLPCWQCHQCGTRFDTFAADGHCPNCGTEFAVTSCPDCGAARPLAEWIKAVDV
jgi:Zn-dependent protease